MDISSMLEVQMDESPREDNSKENGLSFLSREYLYLFIYLLLMFLLWQNKFLLRVKLCLSFVHN